MSRELYGQLMDEMDRIVAKVKPYPEHLQPTIIGQLCAALFNGKDAVTDSGISGISEAEATDPTGGADDGIEDAWDYRRELIQLEKENDMNVKKLNGQEFSAYLAYVFKVRGPEGPQK